MCLKLLFLMNLKLNKDQKLKMSVEKNLIHLNKGFIHLQHLMVL